MDERLQDLLVDIAEFLDGYSDVRDGPDGEQLPNRAMQLLSELEQYLP